MLKLMALLILLLPALGQGQVLYDPTVRYDGDGDMFDLDSLRELHLTFYDPDYHDTLVNRWFAESEERVVAQLDLGNIHLDSVGVKYKGNSTFFLPNSNSNPKLPFNIDMNYYVSGQKLLDYKKLKLANGYTDPTFCKEALSSYFYKRYLPCPEVNLMKVYTGGNYLGLYVNTESVNRQFLEKHFGERNGVFFKCEPSAQYGTPDPFIPADMVWKGAYDSTLYQDSYERKSDTGWHNFMNLIDVINNDPTSIPDVLNVDRLLWFYAVSTVLPNEDTYNTMYMHNYYVYRTGDGRYQILPWDLSESYVGALLSQGSAADHYERDPYYGYSPFVLDRPMLHQILSDPHYHKLYAAHLRTVINESFDATFTKSVADSIQNLCYTAMDTDPNKTFPTSSFNYNVDNELIIPFVVSIAGITSTINMRKPFLQAHPEIMKQAPTIVSTTQSVTNPRGGENVYIYADVTGATEVYLLATTSPYHSDFSAIQMLDDGTNGDAQAGDGIYTALIPYQTTGDHVQYYIRAEDSDAMSLDPERAEFFFYHYYVGPPVEEPIGDLTINVYPNPFQEYVNVVVNNALYDPTIALYDSQGKKVREFEATAGTAFRIYGEGLSSGLYILSAYDGRSVETEKVVFIER